MSKKKQWAFELGMRVRDRQTGFVGIVAGRAEYLYDVDSYGRARIVDFEETTNKRSSLEWVNERRLAHDKG